MDGTLVDSTECVERHWTAWAARHGLDATAILSRSHGRQTLDTIREFAPDLATQEELDWFYRLERTDCEGIRAVSGAAEILAALPAPNWAVVTSASRKLAAARLRHCQLPTPTVLVSAEDVSRGKPDPEGYLLAARQLGFPPAECLVIEDTPAGIDAARSAGMSVLGITTTSQLDGTPTISDFTVLQIGSSSQQDRSHLVVFLGQL